MSEALISVIIPCFNSEKYLEQALKSILWQTYSHWECILIDDGSTDTSAEIFHSYMKNDNRFVYHCKKNAGPSAARNTGIDLAKGEYIQFLDADDILLPERFALCLYAFETHSHADVIYSDYITFQKGQGYSRLLPAKIPHEDTLRAFLFENNLSFAVIIHSLLLKSEVAKNNKFDTSLHSHAEDIECWIRMALNGVRFAYLDRVLCIYRFTQSSLGSDEVKLLKAKIKVLEQYCLLPQCQNYGADFKSSFLYYKQRLAIAYFMKREFRNGFSEMKKIWRNSSSSAKIKMAGWGLLMFFFSKATIATSRAWIVKHTPFKWGAWRQIEFWNPPLEIKSLLGE